MNYITETYYEIHVDGKPLRLSSHSNNGEDYCGSRTYELTEDDYWPILKLESEKEIASFLRRGDTIWYNSDENRPVWKHFTADQMTFVKVTVEREQVHIEMKEQTLVEEIVGKHFDTRSVISFQIKKYPDLNLTSKDIMLYVSCMDDGKFQNDPNKIMELYRDKEIIRYKGDGYYYTLKGVDVPSDDYYYVFLERHYQE